MRGRDGDVGDFSFRPFSRDLRQDGCNFLSRNALWTLDLQVTHFTISPGVKYESLISSESGISGACNELLS